MLRDSSALEIAGRPIGEHCGRRRPTPCGMRITQLRPHGDLKLPILLVFPMGRPLATTLNQSLHRCPPNEVKGGIKMAEFDMAELISAHQRPQWRDELIPIPDNSRTLRRSR